MRQKISENLVSTTSAHHRRFEGHRPGLGRGDFLAPQVLLLLGAGSLPNRTRGVGLQNIQSKNKRSNLKIHFEAKMKDRYFVLVLVSPGACRVDRRPMGDGRGAGGVKRMFREPNESVGKRSRTSSHSLLSTAREVGAAVLATIQARWQSLRKAPVTPEILHELRCLFVSRLSKARTDT